MFFFYFILCLLFISTLNFLFIKTATNKKNFPILKFIFEKHPFAIPFCLLLFAWLPYLIIKYPGTPGWDFYHFLNNYYNYDNSLTHHFPLFYVFMCMSFIKFGISKNNINFGLFSLTLFHTLFMLFSFSYVFTYLKKWNINLKFRLFLLLFFCLNPLFCHYSTTLYHDIIYSSLLLLYTLILTDITIKNSLNKKEVAICVLALLICLTRKNGIFLIIPIHICIFYHFCKEKKNYLKKSLLLLPIFIYFLSNYILSLSYPRTSVLEALSVPLQTISRYSKEYHSSISEKELQAINRVIDYETIQELYNPTIVDTVRNEAGNYNCNTKDILYFFKTWTKLFFRHPDSYIQAFINNTYQLYYPFEKTTYFFFKVKEEEDYKTILDFQRPMKLNPYVDNLQKIDTMFQKIPFLTCIDDPGIYVWLLFYLIVKCRKNNMIKKDYLPLYPVIFTFLICLVGPTIDFNTRYAFPIIFSIFPLWAFYSSYLIQKKKIEKIQ